MILYDKLLYSPVIAFKVHKMGLYTATVCTYCMYLLTISTICVIYIKNIQIYVVILKKYLKSFKVFHHLSVMTSTMSLTSVPQL